MESFPDILSFIQGGIDTAFILLAYRFLQLEKKVERERQTNRNFAINANQKFRALELFMHKRFSFPGFNEDEK